MRTTTRPLILKMRLVWAGLLLVAQPILTQAAEEHVLFAIGQASDTHRIYSLDDNNLVTITDGQRPPGTPPTYTTHALDKGEYIDVALEFQALGDTLASHRAIAIGSDTFSPNWWVNTQLAGKQFAVPYDHGDHTLDFYATVRDAVVNLDIQGVAQQISVLQGEVVSVPTGSANGFAALIDSDEPILVLHRSGSQDVFAVPPATHSLWGLRSQTAVVAAFEDATTIAVTASDGSNQVLQLDAGETQSIAVGTSLSQGQGDALMIAADKPVAALQIDDGDGAASVPFASQAHMANRHFVSSDAQYVVAVCTQPGSALRLYGPSFVPQVEICSGAAGAPGMAYFGSASPGVHVPAGAWLESESPVMVIAETQASEEESPRTGLSHTYYLIDPDSGLEPISIVGLLNDTRVVAGSMEYVVDQGEQVAIPAGALAQGDRIQSSDDIGIGFVQGSLVHPISDRLMGTEFAIPHVQGDHTYDLLSPNQDTMVEITIGTNTATVSLPEGEVVSYGAGSDSGLTGLIRADTPILVSHRATITKKVQGQDVVFPVDAYAVVPAATELWGVRSKKAYAGALEDGTTLDIWASNGATKSYTLDAGGQTELKAGQATSNGEGSGLHIIANKPIAAVQFDDTDGDSTSAFLPYALQDSRYALPTGSQYVAVVCSQASTQVTVTQPGQAPNAVSCVPSGQAPGVSYVGSSSEGENLSVATSVESDTPVYIQFEPAVSNAESQLLGTRGRARPNVPQLDPLLSQYSELPVTITGTADPGVDITLFANGQPIETTVADSFGVFSVSTSILDEGINPIHAVASLQGVESAPSEVLLLDYVPYPDPPVLDPIASPVSNAEVVLTGTAEPDMDIQVFLNGEPGLFFKADGTGAFQTNLTLAEGDNTIYAVAGTFVQSAPSNTLLVTYIPPPPPPSSPALDSFPSPTTESPITITGTAEPGITVRIYLGGLLHTTTVADGSGLFSASVDLQAGPNAIYATAWDGNLESSTSNVLNIEYQSNPGLTEPILDAPVSPTNDNPYLVSGIAASSVVVSVYVDGVLEATVSSDSVGLFSASVPLLDGVNEITATMVEGGIESASSAPIQVEYINNVPRLQSGTISQDTVWTAGTGEPYVITGNIQIPIGVSLIVQRGVTIKVNQGREISVSGTIDIRGKQGLEVLMTSSNAAPSPANWEGFNITSGGKLFMDYGVLEYANEATLFRAATSGLIRHSTLRFNRYGVFAFGNLQAASNPAPVINQSALYGNTVYNYNTLNFGNPATTVLNAQSNWWGTATVSGIESTVNHRPDSPNSSLPVVDYSGYLDSDGGAPVPSNPVLPFNFETDTTISTGDYELLAISRVNPGVTVTIEAGVSIYAGSSKFTFEVFGTLVTQGALGNPVTFTSAQPTPGPSNWSGITVKSGGNLLMERTVVEYATFALLFDAGSTGNITNSTLRYSSVGVQAFGNGQVANNPTPIINQSAIYGNSLNFAASGYANAIDVTLDARNNWWGSTDLESVADKILSFSEDAYLQVDLSLVDRPWVDYRNYLDAENGVPAGANESLFGRISTDRTISSGNYELLSVLLIDPGVTVTIQPGTTIYGPKFTYSLRVNGSLDIAGNAVAPVSLVSGNANPSSDEWLGIEVYSGGVLTMNYASVENALYGLHFYAGAAGTVVNSTLRNNFIGVYMSGNGLAASNPLPIINFSSIYANENLNYRSDSFGNSTSVTLDARNNWWGTTDPNEIAASIHDRTDSTFDSPPYVNFSGFLDSENGSPVSTSTALAGNFTSDTTLTAGAYDLYLAIINPGVTVTIEAGAIIEAIQPGSGWVVDGTLVIQGSSGSPVVLTSVKVPAQADDWSGILVQAGGNLLMDYGLIEYADRALDFEQGSTGIVTNSTLRHSLIGVYVSGNNQAESNPTPIVNLSGIYDNTNYNYYTQSFGSAPSSALNARNNWWGTADVGAIEDSILHLADGGSGRPFVDYDNYLDSEGGNPVTGGSALTGVYATDTTITVGVYDLLSLVVVNPGVTVTIEAGTMISAVHPDFGWEVNGTLIIQGLEGSPVLMTSAKTSAAPGDWSGIRVQSGGNLVMDYGVVEYANRALSFRSGSTGTITHSTLRNSFVGVEALGNSQAETNPTPVVNFSGLYGNTTHNYYTQSFGNASATVLNAQNNWWGTANSGAIEDTVFHRTDTQFERPIVDYSSYLDAESGNPVAGNPGLVGNFSTDTIIATGTYDLLSLAVVDTGVTVTIEAGTLINAGHPQFGWEINGTLVVQGVSGDPVVMTSALPSAAPGDWSGIRIESGGNLVMDYGVIEFADRALDFEEQSTGTVVNSTLRSSLTGIFVTGNGQVASNPTPVVNLSGIYSNVNDNYYTQNFGNASSTVLNARSNWWGTANVNAIEETVFHRPDSTSQRPIVDYSGYLDAEGGDPVAGNSQLVGVYSTNSSIPAGNYDLLSSVVISSGVTVTIEAGTTIYSDHPDFGWEINGTLIVQGSSGVPVVMTSAMIPAAPGDWRGIVVQSGGNLIMDYGVVEYAERALDFEFGSTGTVTNSTLRNSLTGVHVAGINQVATNPSPVVNFSSLYANVNYNYFVQNFGAALLIQLNAQDNWWGSSEVDIIDAGIFDFMDTSSLKNPLVDLLGFKEFEGGPNAFGIFSRIITSDVANPFVGDVATLSFKTNTPATSRLRIYEAGGSTLLNEFTQSHAAAGVYEYLWDGKDQSGSYLPNGVYRLELYATDGANESTWDPATPNLIFGGVTGGLFGSYNAYKNNFMKANFSMARSGLLTVEITPSSESTFNALYQQPFEKGDHSYLWDGRRPDGSLVNGPSTVLFDVPLNLRPNGVIVEGSQPEILGTGVAPDVEVKSDPYRITLSYDQLSSIIFRLSLDSDVTVKLLPPGIYDPQDAAAVTLLDNTALVANDGSGNPIDHTVQWVGYGGTDTNEMLVAQEGAYTFTIEATSVLTGYSSMYRGILQLQP